MANKQFAVIGLGRFGTSVATTLSELGHDVLAIDTDEHKIQDIISKVTHAVQMDGTDEYALKTLGIRNFDVVIVTIGENIQQSIMITLLLKEAGVKYIICKAVTELHKKVLLKIGADRVVLPDKDMGVRVAHNLVSSNLLDFIELSPEYSIMEIQAPKQWIDKSIRDIDARAKFGINIMALKNDDDININPSPSDTILHNTVIICIGSNDDLQRLEKFITDDK